MQYFFIRFIYGIVQWESVCNHIFSADVRIYYGVPFGIAEIFRGNGRMACSPACGAFHAYADGISDMQASETVQLFLKERHAGKIDRSENLRVTVVGKRMEKRHIGERNDTTIRRKGY